jgi:hypothetical protein
MVEEASNEAVAISAEDRNNEVVVSRRIVVRATSHGQDEVAAEPLQLKTRPSGFNWCSISAKRNSCLALSSSFLKSVAKRTLMLSRISTFAPHPKRALFI